jgi:alkylhydroperoxidase/carboxymuconolactone decarboxylase family protein YurZ
VDNEIPRPDVLEALPMPAEIRDDMQELVRVAGALVWNRPGIPAAQRSMVTIAILTALGRWDELRFHIGFGLDNGLSRDEVCEVLMHAAVYAGFPASVSGMRIASEVFAERS